jgi:hypothetical protein
MRFLLIFIGIFSYVATQPQDNGFLPNVCFCVTSKSCGFNYGNVTLPSSSTVSSENEESETEETSPEDEITTTSITFPDGESSPEGEQVTTQRNNRPSE